MEARDGGAFGSHVTNVNGGAVPIQSVGHQIVRANKEQKWTDAGVQSTGVLTEMKIKIPNEAKPHLVEYLALQMEAMDEERLQNDVDAY